MKYHLCPTEWTNNSRLRECLTLSVYLLTYEFIFSTSFGPGSDLSLHPAWILTLLALINALYLKFYRSQKQFVRILKFGLMALASLQFSLYCSPAQARLFVPIEEFLKKCFPLSDDLVGTTFNSLRGIVLLYLAWALVRALKLAQEGEDWLTIAKTPLIFMLVVFVSDAVATFMVQGVTC